MEDSITKYKTPLVTGNDLVLNSVVDLVESLFFSESCKLYRTKSLQWGLPSLILVLSNCENYTIGPGFVMIALEIRGKSGAFGWQEGGKLGR